MVHHHDFKIGILLGEEQGKVFFQLMVFRFGHRSPPKHLRFLQMKALPDTWQIQEEKSIKEKLEYKQEKEDKKEDK